VLDLVFRKPWIIVFARSRSTHVPIYCERRVTCGLYRYVRRAGRL